MRPAQTNKPVRTCVICRRQYAKMDLQRFVWECQDERELLDRSQIMAGRGVYCCSSEACSTRFTARKYAWQRAFRLKK